MHRRSRLAVGALGGVMCSALLVVPAAFADQLVCVHASAYDRAMSDLAKVAGNKWEVIADAQAYTGIAYTAPGANDTAGGPNRPWLVYKLPEPVKAGEGTKNGKKWQIWVHMRVITDANSFYWQTSQDAKTWLPATIDNTCRVNDDAVNNSNKWWWQDQLTGNAGAKDPVIEVGENWVRIGSREAKPDAKDSPRFDVVCFKNFGALGAAGAPDEAQVKRFVQMTPVEPRGKAALTWGGVKAAR
jgi:hypothetical protein